jgi:hypothetical protein
MEELDIFLIGLGFNKVYDGDDSIYYDMIFTQCVISINILSSYIFLHKITNGKVDNFDITLSRKEENFLKFIEILKDDCNIKSLIRKREIDRLMSL